MATPGKIKPKLDIKAKFTGASGECPDGFLRQYNLIASVAGWSEGEIITYFPLYLANSASDWGSTITVPAIWDELQILFRKTFSSPVDRDFPELRLHDRKYDFLTESLHNYYFNKISCVIKLIQEWQIKPSFHIF